jgi:uncharacterized protein YrrD
MTRRDKDFLGLEVISLEDASVAGEVGGVILDARENRVAGFLVDLGIFEAKGLAFSEVRSIGEDAVMIESTSLVRPISEHRELERLVLQEVFISESMVITDQGDIVGSAGDFFVDPSNGRLRAIELRVENDRGEGSYVLPMSAVVAVGADLVMISANYEALAVDALDEL